MGKGVKEKMQDFLPSRKKCMASSMKFTVIKRVMKNSAEILQLFSLN